MINFSYVHLLIGIFVLVIALVVLWKRKKSFSYLLCFSVFWVYIIYVASVIVFPFPVLGNYPYPNFKPSINLVLFDFGSCQMMSLCLRNIFENILLTTPFGFGISFIVRLNPKDFLWLAFLVGFVFEITQLVISFLVRSAFRVVDINDVILNAVGVFLGYGFYRIFGWLYLLATQKFGIRRRHLFDYIYNVVSSS
jgi:glycopeptide antibiotics resistance protein